jgi:formate hydrogenlyase subunit 3/multisubunit Na+/H+ antiporter MnhD subunit
MIAALLWSVAALLAVVWIGVFGAKSRAASAVVYGACALAALAALAVAGGYLLGGAGAPQAATLPLGLPWIGARFRLDPLSAFFLIVVNFGGLAASVYGLGYGRHEPEPGRVLPFYPAFLAGMNLVVLADDAFSFLVAWEFMSLSSWALVMAHHREPANARAGYVYLLMASFGAICLLLAFGLLAGPTGGYAFDAMRAHAPKPGVAGMVLALALLGAGSKAGLVPLHAWLPLAHPAAPSHVSALMSGVMTKVAVYAFVRIVFTLLGAPDWRWGIPLLVLGAASAVLGVLYALMQADVKRVLAYSTIENIGFVFVGLGLALAFRATGFQAAAALAMTAALLHVFNHMLFKSALFFGAGAVLTSTGERDLEQLGGLIHRMPRTAFAVLVSAAAISALPPLNGFVSEWLTLQAILLSPELPQWTLKLLIPAVGAAVALAATLVAACFVRIFGIAFLGRPRSQAAERAREVDAISTGVMLGLALVCLLVGVLPGFAIDALAPSVGMAVGAHMPAQAGLPWRSIVPIAESRSSYDGLLVLLFMTSSGCLAALVIHRFASHAFRRAPAWDCGTPDPNPSIQYSASSFAQPIRRVFATTLFGAREKVAMPAPGRLEPARLKVTVRDPIWERLYAPIGVAVGYAADRVNHLQFLTIRMYLSMVFLALVVLLLVLAIWL